MIKDKEGERLELGSDGYYYLSGESIHAGDTFEMLTDGGAWQRVRFEWNFNPHREGYLIANQRTMTIPSGALFRWGNPRGRRFAP